MRLGLVSYNLAKDWDLPTLIENCRETGFEGVELRTTHAHGVEPDLGADARGEVRRRFDDSGIVLWGLGTTCEYDSPDAAVVERNIEETKRFLALAEDVGARGVKVRPNRLHEGIDPDATCEQIGRALGRLGPVADDHGVDIYLEVHGRGTQHPEMIRRILDVAAHPRVGACWNSNLHGGEVVDGSIAGMFELLAPDITSCHITELWSEYPWPELFARLQGIGYQGFTLAEIPASDDPLRLMRYYRALWLALQRE